MVFNAPFNNISVRFIGGENHWQTLSHMLYQVHIRKNFYRKCNFSRKIKISRKIIFVKRATGLLVQDNHDVIAMGL